MGEDVVDRLRLTALTGIQFLASMLLIGLMARAQSGLETLWPCNAIVLGILIARARSWADVYAVAAVSLPGSLLCHMAQGDPGGLSVMFGVIDVTEAMLGFAVLRRFSRTRTIFDRTSDVAALVGASALASLASVTAIAAGLALFGHGSGFDMWSDWYCETVLSQLIVAPMIVVSAQFADRKRARKLASHTIAEVILLLGATSIVTGIVFLWTSLPLLFLVMPFVLLATFRLRAFGAVGAVAIVAVMSVYATMQGQGPVFAATGNLAGRILLLEAFLACCFLTALPVAAMLTERDARTDEVRAMAERFKAVVENIGEVIFRIDADGQWAYLNPAWETLTGFAIPATLGRPCTELIDEADRAELWPRLQRILEGEGTAVRRTLRFATAEGARWVELFVQPQHDADGAVEGAIGTLRDIDDRKRLEEHVMTAKRRAEQRAREATLLASTDELTGIANRRAFMAQLEREVAGAAEFGWPLSVAMFDVDHFKTINDRHGHAVGDRVLQAIAARASGAIRGGDLVGRLGGEEFGILMPGASADDAVQVAERLREAMEQARFEQNGLPAVTVSVGVAQRDGLRDAHALLDAADAALYAAKGAGRNRVKIAA